VIAEGVTAQPGAGIATERVLSQDCRARIIAERGHYPNPGAALMNALHWAQAEAGYLPRPVVNEIAELLDIKPIQVHEVVSFYPMYRTRPVGRCHIQVCTNIACALRGARKLVRHAEAKLGIHPGEVTADGAYSLAEVECAGSCGTAPVIQVNDLTYIENATAADIDRIAASTNPADWHAATPLISVIPDGVEGYLLPPNGVDRCAIEDYINAGGYKQAERAWKELDPEAISTLVKDSGLRGRGGAGFSTGMKWQFMPKESAKPSYLAVNCDESEPGTFKDRQILERNPHQFIEGAIIAGRAIRAVAAYVYIRGEYTEPYRRLMQAIDEAYKGGYLGNDIMGTGNSFHMFVQRGAGAYICGEETGMLESMEGRKGQPRKRPPFPAASGLWASPTTVNNFETITHVPKILEHGAEWFKQIGTEKSTGNTLFGVSGHVNRPGVYELPLGTPLREIIEKHAGGVIGGRKIKAIIPGGVSMPVLTADKIDVRMDHDSLREAGTLLGTGGVIVMDDTTCPVRAAAVIGRFFSHESCGQCTQCREGTGFLYKLLKRIDRGDGSLGDLATIERICASMEGQTICALSDAAAWAAGWFLRRFRDDFERHVHDKGCPFPESFEI